MKLEVQGKAVSNAITKIGAVVGKLDTVNIEADKKGAWLHAQGNDSTIKIRVAPPEAVQKTGVCSVHAHMLLGVTRGREQLSIESKGSSLNFKSVSGKYSGTLVVTPHQEIPEPSKGGGKSKDLKFTKALQALIDTALPQVSLNNVFNDDPIYVWMESNDAGTTLVCGDDLHVAHFFNPEIKLGNKSFSLPLSVFRTVGSVAEKDGYKLQIEESHVYAFNDSMEMTVPITQNSGEHTVKMFNDYVRSLKVKPKNQLVIGKEFLEQVLDNASSIFDNKTPLKIEGAGGKITLSVETSYGKINEALKSSVSDWPKKGVMCEAALISDILQAVRPKELTVKLEVDKCLYLQHQEGESRFTYICVLV